MSIYLIKIVVYFERQVISGFVFVSVRYDSLNFEFLILKCFIFFILEGSGGTSNGKTPEDEVCKICMDAMVDCVLLECGHMVSCTECGKRLSECPICRQYVVRVVRTFRS